MKLTLNVLISSPLTKDSERRFCTCISWLSGPSIRNNKKVLNKTFVKKNEIWIDVFERIYDHFLKEELCQYKFPLPFVNIYLLGGSITFRDGTPMTTVATNSGVTFEEKLDAMNVIIVLFLFHLAKVRK